MPSSTSKSSKYVSKVGQEIEDFLEKANSGDAPVQAASIRHERSSSNCFKAFLPSISCDLERFTKLEFEDKIRYVKAWVFASLTDGDGEGSSYHPMYFVNSFRDTYVPHLVKFLYHNNIIAKDQKEVVLDHCRKKVTEMVRGNQVSPSQRQKQSGKTPLMPWDLKHIINTLPLGYLQDYEDF